MVETEEIKKLKQKLKENRECIHISRIPMKTKREFIKLADTEFCSDYGMTLTFLMKGIVGFNEQEILDKLDNHEERIISLESCPKEEKKVRKTLSGKVIEEK